MPSKSLPELIEPGELFIPSTYESRFDVNLGVLPNGDDSLVIAKGLTAAGPYFAYQPAVLNTHYRRGIAAAAEGEGDMAISFWMRVPSAITAAGNTYLMGVGNASMTTAVNNNYSWRIYYDTGVNSLVMAEHVDGANHSVVVFGTGRPAVNTWTLFVLNRWAPTNNRPTWTMHMNTTVTVTGSGTANNQTGAVAADQRFWIGAHPNTLNAVTVNNVNGIEIAKVCIHGRNLTFDEREALYNSMVFS
jgi:hypothetical protein